MQHVFEVVNFLLFSRDVSKEADYMTSVLTFRNGNIDDRPSRSDRPSLLEKPSCKNFKWPYLHNGPPIKTGPQRVECSRDR